jgi:hypothetical protein
MTVAEINRAIIAGTFTNDELNSVIDAVKFARSRVANQVRFQIRNGSQVRFRSTKNNMVHTGKVEKIAIKFVTVATPAGRWKVPMNMLELVA